uniref:Uncharacterized protein n=1 Tax=Caenorhabditis japonica TaxID=281687 RepID=A0A8R1HT16_CAEJA
MSLNKEPPSAVALLQIVIFLQFSASFLIVVLTTVGLSYDYPVAKYYLLALLQMIVAIPGVVHIVIQGNSELEKIKFSEKLTATLAWAALYIAAQMVTSACEIYWLVYMIATNATVSRWICLALLTVMNVSAVVIGLWFRSVMVKMPGDKTSPETTNDPKKDFPMGVMKPQMKAPSQSMMSDSETRDSTKRSSKTSLSGSSKSRRTKKTKSASSSRSKSSSTKKCSSSTSTGRRSPNMPRDSRECANSPLKSF